MKSNESEGRAFGWRPLLGCVVLLAAAWYLRNIAILVFGSVLIAAVLHAFAAPLTRVTGLSRRPAIAVVLVAILAIASAAVWWIGSPLVTQLALLGADLPHAWGYVSNWLSGTLAGSRLLSAMHGLSSVPLPVAGIANATEVTLQTLSGVVLILLMGVYLAFDVSLYVNGLVRLFPVPKRSLIQNTLDDAGKSLTRWLTGQGVTMLVVAIAVSAGLLILGMPLALALGFIAGMLEFVPFFGPIASGLLAVLVAFAQGPHMALYVALLFLVVQQLEGNVLVPMVQRWAVKLPPLLSVAAVIVFGTIFGIPGILFGTPLMVVTIVMVRHLWIEAVLEETPDETGRTTKAPLDGKRDRAPANK